MKQNFYSCFKSLKNSFCLKTSAFLVAALTFSAGSLAADNLIVNGDFEDKSYTTFEFEGAQCPVKILGWDAREEAVENDFNNLGLEKWNIFGQFMNHVTSGPLVTEGNTQYLRIQRYAWGGWGDGGVQTTIEVTGGETYELSCIYSGETVERRRNWNDWYGPDIARFIRVYENEVSVDNLLLEEIIPDARTIDWTAFKKNVQTKESTTKIVIAFGLNGFCQDEGEDKKGKGKNDVWFGIDNVQLTSVQQETVEISSLEVDKASLDIPADATKESITPLLAELLITGKTADNNTIGVENDIDKWTISDDLTEAVFKPTVPPSGYSFASGLSVSVKLNHSKLITSLKASVEKLNFEGAPTEEVILDELVKLVITGTDAQGQEYTISNVKEGWKLKSEGVYSYAPSGLVSDYEFAEGVEALVSIEITTGIDDFSGDIQKVYSFDGNLYLQGFEAGQSYQVYSVGGGLVAQGIISGAEEQVVIPGQGAYLVVVNNVSYKIVIG